MRFQSPIENGRIAGLQSELISGFLKRESGNEIELVIRATTCDELVLQTMVDLGEFPLSAKQLIRAYLSRLKDGVLVTIELNGNKEKLRRNQIYKYKQYKFYNGYVLKEAKRILKFTSRTITHQHFKREYGIRTTTGMTRTEFSDYLNFIELYFIENYRIHLEAFTRPDYTAFDYWKLTS